MAEEVKKILTVETGRSFDSIRSLKAEIKELNRVVETGTKLIQDENGELREVQVTSQEYDKAVKQLAEDKRTLADVTNMNKNAWNGETQASEGTAKSYRQLQAEMRQLRVEWRNTASADDRKVIAAQINDINNQLKAMDAEIGDYQRNVGDYFNSIQKSLGGIPGPAGRAVGSINNVTASLKALIATPAAAAIAAISVAVLGASKVFKDFDDRLQNNEELQLQYMRTTERARAIMDAYIAKLDEMGGEYAELRAEMEVTKAKAEVFFKSLFLHLNEASDTGKWMPIVGLFKQIRAAWKDMNDASSEDNPYIKKEEAISVAYKKYLDTYRDSIKKQAEIEKIIAESNLISADSEKGARERLAAVELSIEKTNELFAEQERVFESKKLLVMAEADAGKNSIEVNNKLEELEADLIRLGTAREHQQRRLIALRARLRKEIAASAKAVEEEVATEEEAIESLDETLDLSSKNWQQWARTMSEAASREAARRKTEAEMSIADEESRAQAVAEIDAALLQKKLDYINQAIEAEGDPSRLVELYEQRKDAALAVEKQKFDEINRLRKKDEENEKKSTENKKRLANTYANVTSDLFSNIADAIEASAAEDEKAQKGVKALRIAAATIDTIQAAISSYNAMSGIPYVGPALGAAAAAAATAMGVANIAKIKSTNVSRTSSGGGGSVSTASVSNIVSAPAVVQEVPVTRTLTGASEEAAANAEPAESRVVLVMSDLEAKQGEIASRKVETSF